LVKQKLTDVLYRIHKSPNQRTLVVHVEHLKPYLGENVPELWQDETEVVTEQDFIENGIFNDETDSQEYFEGEPHIETPNRSREENIPTSEPVTPPRLTRCGRQVNKLLKYTP
jgi:hypothetical protein